MARVRLESVTKKYGDVAAVSDFSLEVRDKEFFVLLGPSGCGKSTVLRLIAGLETPTSGDIYIGDRLVNTLPARDRDIAMVFESPSYALYPHLTAYDNMASGLTFRKTLPATREAQPGAAPPQPDTRQAAKAAREGEIRERVERVAGRLRLQDYLKRKRSELSAGHSQTVALGRAMVREPQVFLMDDPLSQLDTDLRAAGRAELRALHSRLNATIIYVTHNQADATALGNRVGVMDNGVLQQIGTSQSLYRYPDNMFIAGFIGSPAMNMFEVSVASEGDSIFFDGPGFRLRVPEHYAGRLAGWEDRRVVMGLRPEDIHDARLLPGADPQAIVHATVQVREYLGSEIDLHLSTAGHEFVARVDDRTTVRRGDDLDVVFDTDKMHVFNPSTQRALL